ncbi:tetraspanin-7-like [Ptychodera flava]|uniref:tetraspanin-7-like n=1 Tax=Ptychodera flava TaxID=63121 RepID=UPI00396A793C
MLKFYMGILTMLFMGEIGIALFLYFMEAQFLSYVKIGWKYLDQETKDLVQDQLMCCGFQNYTEYETPNITQSCYQNATDPTSLYDTGCYDMFVKFLIDNLTYSASIGGTLVFLEIVGILLSCYAMKAFEKDSKVGPGRQMRPINRMDYAERRAWEI